MTGTARAKAKVAVKAVKPQKPKYALVFFEDKKEQSVVTVSDIKGEPTVGEYRDVQWTPDECFRAKVVLIGKNFNVLLKSIMCSFQFLALIEICVCTDGRSAISRLALHTLSRLK